MRRGCNLRMNCRRRFLVFQLDQNLGVVELLQLRRDGKPEARPAASHESRDVVKNRSRLSVFADVRVRTCAASSRTTRSTSCATWLVALEIGAVGQPDVDVGPVLDILGKEGQLQTPEENDAESPETPESR